MLWSNENMKIKDIQVYSGDNYKELYYRNGFVRRSFIEHCVNYVSDEYKAYDVIGKTIFKKKYDTEENYHILLERRLSSSEVNDMFHNLRELKIID